MKNQAHYLESTTHVSARCACGVVTGGKDQFEALKKLERHIRNPKPSPGMRPFTEGDLFTEYAVTLIPASDLSTGAVLHTCSECGACVTQPETHVAWHNKVADL